MYKIFRKFCPAAGRKCKWWCRAVQNQGNLCSEDFETSDPVRRLLFVRCGRIFENYTSGPADLLGIAILLLVGRNRCNFFGGDASRCNRCNPLRGVPRVARDHGDDPGTMYDHFYPLIASLDSLELLQSAAGSAGGSSPRGKG